MCWRLVEDSEFEGNDDAMKTHVVYPSNTCTNDVPTKA